MSGSKPAIPLGNTARVPVRWRRDVERILISGSEIERRLRVMAREIQRDFSQTEMVVVSLLNGTVMFLADLVRRLSLPLHLDFIGVSSYRANTKSGELVFTKNLRLDVRGRDVLLVDDILDTGKTLTRVREKLGTLGPKQIRICVLLDKPSRRQFPVQANYVGFEIPDVFVVGSTTQSGIVTCRSSGCSTRRYTHRQFRRAATQKNQVQWYQLLLRFREDKQLVNQCRIQKPRWKSRSRFIPFSKI